MCNEMDFEDDLEGVRRWFYGGTPPPGEDGWEGSDSSMALGPPIAPVHTPRAVTAPARAEALADLHTT
jgi:hypothetical protein